MCGGSGGLCDFSSGSGRGECGWTRIGSPGGLDRAAQCLKLHEEESTVVHFPVYPKRLKSLYPRSDLSCPTNVSRHQNRLHKPAAISLIASSLPQRPVPRSFDQSALPSAAHAPTSRHPIIVAHHPLSARRHSRPAGQFTSRRRLTRPTLLLLCSPTSGYSMANVKRQTVTLATLSHPLSHHGVEWLRVEEPWVEACRD